LADYTRHLTWINNTDYEGSVTEIQEKLSRLQLSILRHSRFMVLQFPFWTTFFLSDKWFPHSVGWGYIVFQCLLTASFTYLAFWLYRNHTMNNANKKWVKLFIKASGGKSVLRAINFYKQIQDFKQGI
jgi:hypothetical protein